jgi:hypothetical protein
MSLALPRLTCAVVTALLVAPLVAHAQSAQGSFEKTLTVGQRPEVEIEAGSGGIDVRPGAAGRIEIRGRIRTNDWGWRRGRYTAEERVKQLETNPPVTQSGDVVRIGQIADDDLRNGVSISYEVTVPAATTLRAKSGSGSQRIEGVDGNVEATTGSGSITVRRSGARVRASTGSGSINADAIGGDFAASTGSGSITGTNISGAMKVHTSSGSIELVQSGAGDVDATSSSGTVKIRGVKGGVRAST